MSAPSAHDVCVIGGGITGAGVARDLSLRGLSVLLLEKGDWGAGTTGASSWMIHGGPRYLEFDWDTTRLSCVDAGHIVTRSEEHTSELQSQSNLVCRLLLGKQ